MAGERLNPSANDEIVALKQEIAALREQSKIKVLNVAGHIVNSGQDPIVGSGYASVTLNNGLATVEFSAQITVAGTTPGVLWGVNRNLLSNANPEIPTITPIAGGRLLYYNTDGTLINDYFGFGGMAVPENEFWHPSRMYLEEGTIGPWDASAFGLGIIITGVVYGTY